MLQKIARKNATPEKAEKDEELKKEKNIKRKR
jgi:hypothetical protein